MRSEEEATWISMGFLATAAAGLLIGASIRECTMKRDAVKSSVAEWVANPETGKAEFKYKNIKGVE